MFDDFKMVGFFSTFVLIPSKASSLDSCSASFFFLSCIYFLSLAPSTSTTWDWTFCFLLILKVLAKDADSNLSTSVLLSS